MPIQVFTPIRLHMTLLDIYEKHLRLTEMFLQKAGNTPNWPARDSFRSRALEHQSHAGYIAHCIAMFGNLNLAEIHIEELLARAKQQKCLQENPWTRGLALIQKEMAVQVTKSISSPTSPAGNPHQF